MRITPIILALVLALQPTHTSGQDRHDAVVDGTRLSYRTAGSGEPLLLLHGFGETGASWDPIVEPLAEEYRLIVPDLPGHGHSGDLTGDFAFRDAASDVVALLDHLGIRETRAMGFSAGGIILLHIATAHPERLDRAVMIGTGPYIPRAAREFMRAMDADAIPMEELQSGELAQPDTARTRDLVRRFVALADDRADPSFTPPLLRSIRSPVLLVTGDLDPFFPPGLVQEMHEAIPESHLFVLPNHPHRPFPGDEVGRRYFVSTVRAFLSGAWESLN
jgi:pimeloyl-ACP methyl ester carboxylesterase